MYFLKFVREPFFRSVALTCSLRMGKNERAALRDGPEILISDIQPAGQLSLQVRPVPRFQLQFRLQPNQTNALCPRFAYERSRD